MLDLPRPRQLFAQGTRKVESVSGTRRLLNVSLGHTTLKLRLLILGAAVTLRLDWQEKIIPEIDTLVGTRAGEAQKAFIIVFPAPTPPCCPPNMYYPSPALLTMQMTERSLWEVVLEVC